MSDGSPLEIMVRGGGIKAAFKKMKTGMKSFADSAKGKAMKEFMKKALSVALDISLSWLDDLIEVGVDCANFYLQMEIVKQVKPSIDLINNFIYPFLEVLNLVEKQQKIDREFVFFLNIFLNRSYLQLKFTRCKWPSCSSPNQSMVTKITSLAK